MVCWYEVIKYLNSFKQKYVKFSTFRSTLFNFVNNKSESPSHSTNLRYILASTSIEPWEYINIISDLYKNNCKLELSVLQRLELYNVCNDVITGGLQNPLPLKTFISEPINTYFDIKFSSNRINTLLANQIDTNSTILLRHNIKRDSNIYLLPKDGIETVGSLNNSVRFDNSFNQETHIDFYQQFQIDLDSSFNYIFNKSSADELVKLLKYLYLMDTPLNINLLNMLSKQFISNIYQLSSMQISETAYILSSYFNDIKIPNVTNSLSYHSQNFIYNNLNFNQNIITPLYLLCHCNGNSVILKSIISKLIINNYLPDNIPDGIRLQIILSKLDMMNDSLVKKISNEINNQIVNHFNNITEPELIHIARLLSRCFTKTLCDILLNFVIDNINDLHMDSISSIYLYLSGNKLLSNDNNKIMNNLLVHINNHLGSVSGGLIPDIYRNSIKQSNLSDSVMKLFEKNLLLNKKYLTSKDISNMIMPLTLYGKDQKVLIKILLEQFLHLKNHNRSNVDETLDIILAFSLVGVKHPEMWNNIDLPVVLNNVNNNLLVYIGYAFLITEFNCNICWSIIVERLLYENIQHSADLFKVLKIAQIFRYIHLLSESSPVPNGSAVISDPAAIKKFKNTINECKQINLNKLNSAKKYDDIQKYNELLVEINVPFECNYIVDDLYMVSFYLPSYKILIDIIYENDIKCTGKVNGEIMLKHKVIKAMGYNLIVITSDWIKSFAKENLKKRTQLFSKKLGIIAIPKKTVKNKSSH